MNTSWLSIGQTTLAVFAIIQTIFVIVQYGKPNTALKILSYITSLSISLTLVFDASMWHGFNILFYFPELYSVLIGVVSWSWIGIVGFGVVEEPTQIHRKILWRLPLLGGLLGYAIPIWISVSLLSVFWIAGFIIVSLQKSKFRYILRIYVFNLVLIFAHIFCLNRGYLFFSQICYALWIVLVHRIIASFLLKDKIFESLVKPAQEVKV